MSRGKAMTRRLVLALAIVAFGFASLLSGCGSDNASTVDVSIVGTWKVVHIGGGESGVDITPNTNRTVEFTEDGKVTWYEDDEPTYSASYTTGIDKTIYSLDPLPVIYLSDGWGYTYSFPNSRTLSLAETAYDGFWYTCQRV
jgi:ABC-type Fe3+-hydroxamate transport system substrate-binding protein